MAKKKAVKKTAKKAVKKPGAKKASAKKAAPKKATPKKTVKAQPKVVDKTSRKFKMAERLGFRKGGRKYDPETGGWI